MKTNPDSTDVKYENLLSPRVIALCLLAGVLLLMVLGVAGCNGLPKSAGVNTSGPAEVVGDYVLVGVDGKPVPCVVSHEGQDVQVKSGRFAINGDGTCHSVSTFSVSSHPDVHRVVDAT